jgi:ribosomal-protein-alanine N-acetyltransferase
MNDPHLQTDRLVCRPFRADDLDDLAALYADAEVMRFLAQGRPLDREQTRERLERMLRHWREHGFGMWALFEKEGGGFLGRCGVNYAHRPGEAELAYTLARRSWGRGLATEAAGAVLRNAFAVLRLPRVVAFARLENVASQRVMQKLGMSFQEACSYNDVDAVMYALGSGS